MLQSIFGQTHLPSTSTMFSTASRIASAMKDMMSLADSVLPAPDLGPENGCRDVRFPVKKTGRTNRQSITGRQTNQIIFASCFCQRGENRANVLTVFENTQIFIRSMHILRYVTGLGWWGMLTFMLTCVTCTSYVTSLGWGVGHVHVHVNLRHMHILGYVTGLGGWGMLTFMLTCVACTSYVTSLGWGVGDFMGWGVGDVNVHVNLRHMHILRYVTGLGGWEMLTFMLTCVTCTSYVTSLGWGVGAC